MQTRARNAVVLAAVVAVTALGLGAIAKARKPLAVPSKGGLDAVPTGAMLVATADLAAVRASPVAAPLLREWREGSQVRGAGKVNDVCGFDPLDAVTELTFAIPEGGDSGEFGVVAVGKLDDDALVACATKVIEARGGHAVVTRVGAFRSVRDAESVASGTSDASRGEIAVRRGGPLLFGGGSYLRSMIDTVEGRSASVRRAAGHTELAAAIGEAPVRATARFTTEQRRTLAEELAHGGAAGDPLASLRGAAIGVALGAKVSVHAVLACEAALPCAALAQRLDEARRARSKDVVMRLLGVSPILEQAVIEPSGVEVHVRAEVPAADAVALLERVLALRSMRPPAGANGSEPPR